MKERPILFKPKMVEAILAGGKTMTRRILKLKGLNGHEVKSIQKDGSGKGWVAWSPREVSAEETAMLYPGEEGFKCPYGQPGDVLWVRETWQYVDIGPGDENNGYVYKASENGIAWEENDESWKWRPSLFMPRSACRLRLEITNIKVERLQDISKADAIAEGIESWVENRIASKPTRYKCYVDLDSPKDPATYCGNPIDSFQSLWFKINGKESWDANPWLWVIEFKPI